MVDFCSFEKVTCIHNCFLQCCSSLETISNISGLRNVKSIGWGFLKKCNSLAPIDGWEELREGRLKEEMRKRFGVRDSSNTSGTTVHWTYLNEPGREVGQSSPDSRSSKCCVC
eukprot:TRINITY_DN34903_c0_g1_i1.p1 TRINITY_DN34903_c0_g1~~TRINITY_DN34903_c0_g1_i1.p1  ORF type:complete len:113 (+),score=15.61 TRINITY_DN34903_c0_g1_i1:2-340(+)